MRTKVGGGWLKLGLGLWEKWMKLTLGLKTVSMVRFRDKDGGGMVQVRVWIGRARFRNDSGVLCES